MRLVAVAEFSREHGEVDRPPTAARTSVKTAAAITYTCGSVADLIEQGVEAALLT